MEEISEKLKKINLSKNQINDEEFWNLLIKNNIKNVKNPIEYLLKEFGTGLCCNRFDVGNTIEFIIGDYIKSCGLKIIEMPNSKRFDISINNYKKLSIKYSSSGDITLHNSNSSINKDLDMKDTLLLTPEKLWLITESELHKNNFDIKNYIESKGDSLKLRRKILKELEKIKYPYVYEIGIEHNKGECKNRLCSKIFYKEFIKEYESMYK